MRYLEEEEEDGEKRVERGVVRLGRAHINPDRQPWEKGILGRVHNSRRTAALPNCHDSANLSEGTSLLYTCHVRRCEASDFLWIIRKSTVCGSVGEFKWKCA